LEAIPHCGLMRAVEERVCDQAVLALIRTLLRAGVMQAGRCGVAWPVLRKGV
jgi:RNA-directed DNA polymerase